MNSGFKGKRILVTGGCQGIGKGIVLELWRQGADVVTLSNKPDNLHKLKTEYPSIEVVEVDLRDWNRTREVVDGLGVFDGLVNNAGVAIPEPFLSCSPEAFDEMISVNTKAIINVSQIVAKKMIDNGIKGSIVNISSQSAKVGIKGRLSYCASKGAVDSLTRVMALELGPHCIRVNTVNPTAVMTDMGRKMWNDPQQIKEQLAKIPLGRFAEIPEVVSAVLFLLHDCSSMTTGAHLPVDGGFLAT